MISRYETLVSSRLLARNVALNLGGSVLTAIVGIVAIPLLVRGLGTDRFGLLALAWVTIGYFSLFDLGIGRALTFAVADLIGKHRETETGTVAWTALILIFPLGVAGSVAFAVLAPTLVERVLNVPPELHAEAVVSFRIFAVAIPFTVATVALRGLLEATQRFGLVNALRVPFGLLTFLGPVASLPFSRSLVPGIAVLTVGRIVLCFVHAVACARTVPFFAQGRFDRLAVKPLFKFGGWMTISNIVSPLMNTLDRFVVAAVLNVSIVAFYATPHELVTKMWLFTAALLPVLFPAFASSAAKDPSRTSLLFDRSLRITIAALFLPTLVLVVLAREILAVWLGPAFATQSSAVMQVLAIAVFVNTLAQAALTLLQSLGRPDLTGKSHLAELPLYAMLLWWLLPAYGIIGVALAWAIRVGIDTLLLFLACTAVLPQTRRAIARAANWIVVIVPLLALGGLAPTTSTRVIVVALAVPVWLAIVWKYLITAAERNAPLALMMRRVSPADPATPA
jgi:O-antigen/teichoic acid export membrane protein